MVLSVPVVVSTVEALPLTVTVSVTDPTLRAMSSRTSSLTRTTTSVFFVPWKPGSAATTRYRPTGRPRSTYMPTSLVIAVVTALVASWVAETVTPGNTPPPASRTTPVTPPVVVWAEAGSAATTSSHAMKLRVLRNMDPPHPDFLALLGSASAHPGPPQVAWDESRR